MQVPADAPVVLQVVDDANPDGVPRYKEWECVKKAQYLPRDQKIFP